MNEPSSDAEFQAAQREFLRMADDLGKFGGNDAGRSLGSLPCCNFCGRLKAEVKAMVQGLNASICDECVREAQRLIQTHG